MSSNEKIILGYWPIRGLLEPLKLICEYSDQAYSLELYHSAEDYQKFKEKQPPFCNLPYLTDGDLFLVQSNACLRHIGRKHGLLGKDPTEMAYADVVCEQVMDLRNAFMDVCYAESPASYQSKVQPFVSAILPSHLAKLSCFLGSCAFFGGPSPLYADFHAYEIIKQLSLFDPEAISAHPNLHDYLARFEALPRISAYLKSDRFHAFPINNTMAHWGSSQYDS